MSDPAITEPNIAAGICSKIKANDEQALRHLYTINYGKVEKYILNNNGCIADAKDIYQEAFLAVWRNIQLNRFTAVHENAIHNYLFQIARNKWLDHLRIQKRKMELHVPEQELLGMTHEQATPEQDRYIEQVKSHYNAMGSPCKELLTKFYFQKLSLKRIAAQFSWTEATAKNNKYRCLQKLRAAILNNK